jgi:eukaryotic-like serine/threonine-protein kinase
MIAIDKTSWEAVSALLDELLDADEERRGERLAELQGHQPALVKHVSALLAEQTAVETEHFLEGTAFDPLGLGTLVGRSIGGYTLERALGQGGMGSVWLGRRSDGRYEGQAAIKFLNLALLGSGGADRLRQEANALAKLAHPNITHLIDAGVAAGQPYLVLEYVEGEPIDRWCDSQGLDVAGRVRLFLQVLAAVSHAHGRLILHRDLKPSNVLVTGEGRAKLLDFGIAKLLEQEGKALVGELTRIGGPSLTPAYAAPEQVQGIELTTATDVYALGVLLYTLLVGSHPTASAASTPVERLQALVEQEPARLSEAALHIDADAARVRGASALQLARTLRGDLDNILAKALKKLSAERYTTVAAFADDLQRYLNQEPVGARADTRAYRVGKFVQRHRLAVGAASVTFVALLAGIVGTTWQAVEARRQQREAVAQANKAEASRRLLDLMINEVGDPEVPVTPVRLLDRGMVLLEAQQLSPSLMADELLHMAARYGNLEELAKEKELRLRAAALARAHGETALVVEANCDLAHSELQQENRDAAKQYLDEATGLLAAMPRPSAVLRAGCMGIDAELLAASGETMQAITLAEQAVDLLQSTGHRDHPLLSAILSKLSNFHHELGNTAESYELTRSSGEAMDRAGLGGTSDRIILLNNEASSLVDFGEVAPAAGRLAEILKRLEARYDDVGRWGIEANYGAVLATVGRTDEALAILDRSIERAQAKQITFWELRSRFFRARTLTWVGRLSEARAELDHVEAEYRRDPVQNRSYLHSVGVARANWLLRSQQVAEADRLLTAVLAEAGYSDGTAPSWLLNAALPLASEIALAAGDAGRAETLATDALKGAQKVARRADRSAHVGRAQLALGKAQLTRGDAAAARTAFAAAVPGLAYGLSPDHELTREAQRLLDPPG